jgi:hypothetical protein
MFTAKIFTPNWRDAEAVQEKVREAGFEVEVLSVWIDECSGAVFLHVWHAGDIDRGDERCAIVDPLDRFVSNWDVTDDPRPRLN